MPRSFKGFYAGIKTRINKLCGHFWVPPSLPRKANKAYKMHPVKGREQAKPEVLNITSVGEM